MQSAGPLKDVAFPYENGRLHFRIPERWVEREESDGAGLYYGEGAETGLLRVKVMSFTSPQRIERTVALAQLEAMDPAPGQVLEQLPNGNALRAHREESRADGESTILYIWMVASVEPPHRLRLAVFSFTHIQSRTDDLGTRRTLTALEREVRAASFAHQLL